MAVKSLIDRRRENVAGMDRHLTTHFDRLGRADYQEPKCLATAHNEDVYLAWRNRTAFMAGMSERTIRSYLQTTV